MLDTFAPSQLIPLHSDSQTTLSIKNTVKTILIRGLYWYDRSLCILRLNRHTQDTKKKCDMVHVTIYFLCIYEVSAFPLDLMTCTFGSLSPSKEDYYGGRQVHGSVTGIAEYKALLQGVWQKLTAAYSQDIEATPHGISHSQASNYLGGTIKRESSSESLREGPSFQLITSFLLSSYRYRLGECTGISTFFLQINSIADSNILHFSKSSQTCQSYKTRENTSGKEGNYFARSLMLQ